MSTLVLYNLGQTHSHRILDYYVQNVKVFWAWLNLRPCAGVVPMRLLSTLCITRVDLAFHRVPSAISNGVTLTVSIAFQVDQTSTPCIPSFT
jgi:hypothetical protein